RANLVGCKESQGTSDGFVADPCGLGPAERLAAGVAVFNRHAPGLDQDSVPVLAILEDFADGTQPQGTAAANRTPSTPAIFRHRRHLGSPAVLARTEAEDPGEVLLNLNLDVQVGSLRITDPIGHPSRSPRYSHEDLDEGAVGLLKKVQ